MNSKGILLTLFLLHLQAALVLGDVQGDVQQILDGNTKVFHSRNHPKAQGLNIKITYPINWKAKEGNRPHIVQNLVNPDSDAMVILQVRNIPSPFTNNDFLDALKESLDNGEPTDLIPPNATLSSQTLSKIDGEECIIMEYQLTGERLGLKIPTHNYTVAIPYSNKLLMVSGMVMGFGLSPTEALEKYEKHKPLIMLITGSLVITEKWTANDSRYSVPYAIGLAIFPALLWSILVLVCLNLFKNRQPTFLDFIYSYIATVTVLACLFLVARDGVSGLVNFGAIAALPISIVLFYLNKRTLQTQQTLPEDPQPFPDEITQTDSTKKGISELKGYFSDLKDNKVDPPDPPPLLVDEPKKKKK